LARKGYGPRRIRAELERKGVASDIVDAAVAAVYKDSGAELKAARRALSKRTGGPGDRATAGRYLERRGYSMSVILTVLDELEFDPGT
jgi:SOS response regulatory protein OraA/RecX